MKVAIIPPTSKTGESTVNMHLIHGLLGRGVDVKILQHFVLNTTNRKIFLGSLLLKRLLNDDSVSLVHNVDNLGPFLFRHKDWQIKKVLTVHDIAPVVLPPQYERIVRDRILRFYLTTVLPKLIDNCDLIIVDSFSTMTDLTAKFRVSKEKIAVVHLGVDTSFFRPSNDCSHVLNKYGLRNKFLLYVGTDSPRKNLKTLIRAYVSIFQEISHDLVLIGPISENKIRTYIESSRPAPHLKTEAQKRIILLGHIAYEELPSIYSSASALVLPSLCEGFGFPPLEAMACGTVAVVSNNSSLREIVDSSAILINDPLDPKEISTRILEALEEEDKSDLKRRAIRQAQKFTWENTVQKTIAAYDKVVQM